jgi:2-succinyl-6-hydroxy-2,4-cyclohexadiene-1-carboxylate synthase
MPFAEIFNNFSDLVFFQSENFIKTYNDFKQDIIRQVKKLDTTSGPKSKIVVKNSDQYFFLVEVFALWSIQKTAILISPKATHLSEQALLSQLPPEDDRDADSTEALILFTSGSTDTPKGVSISFSSIEFQASSFATYFKASHREVYFLNLPLNHVGGLMLCLRAFFTGGVVSTIASHKFSYISLVPHQLEQWISDPVLMQLLASAKAILIGGATLSSSLRTKAADFLLPVFETYGMTETTSFVAINGKILPERELLVAEDGSISIKGRMLATGFYSKQKFYKISEVFTTNDLGYFDEKNNFFFKGRRSSLLVSGGENISTHEIENAARAISGVKTAYVCSIPDEKWGDLVTLLYESTEQQYIDIKKLISPYLLPYHLPKFIFQTKFNTPPELKISLSELKQMAYELFLRNIFSCHHTFRSNDLPTIVVFHGFMESKADWAFFDHEKYNVLTIDLPGHGQTKIENFSSLDEILTRLRDFIFLFTRTPIMIGYSMGGRIALNLCENYLTPDKLILISSSLGLDSSELKGDRLNSDLKLFDKINANYTLSHFLYDWYSTPMFNVFRNSENFSQEISNKCHWDYKTWARALHFFSQGNFPLKKVSAFTYPVFYISGSEDLKYSQTMISSHQIIEGSGHNPHKTHAQSLVKYLSNIL